MQKIEKIREYFQNKYEKKAYEVTPNKYEKFGIIQDGVK